MGVLTLLEALFMLVPTFVAWWYHEADLGAWLVSSVITWINCWWLLGAGRKAEKHVGEREGYVIVAATSVKRVEPVVVNPAIVSYHASVMVGRAPLNQ